MTRTTSLSRHLEIALKEQICADNLVGSLDLEDFTKILWNRNQFLGAVDTGLYLTAQEEERLIAICGLVSQLLEEAETITAHAQNDTFRLP